MKLFNRAQSTEPDTTEDTAEVAEPEQRAGFTAAKGRPTPKRRDAEGKRGPVLPPPTTQREAAKRAKQQRGSREDRRVAAAERRKKMEEGDDRYVLPRDRGPVRAYVRDLVDAKRNLTGLFMPMAVIIFLALFTPVPAIQQYATLAVTVVLALMIIEGIVNGFAITKKVRAKFPKSADRPFSLGWYAFVRSTQIRKLRMPKPRVRAGAKVD